MERLTGRYEDGSVYVRATTGDRYVTHPGIGWPTNPTMEEKLAAYEDTGLEPENIKGAFNWECIEKLYAQGIGIPVARLRELVQAEQAGRLVVLPEDLPMRMNDTLEPMKVKSALDCELRKLKYRKAHKPCEVSVLDYTIIAALRKTLSEAEAVLKGGEG